MSTVTGTVQSVFGPNDYGFFKIKVNDAWHGLGKKKPDVSRGDTVSFDAYLKDGKYSTVKGEITKSTQAAPAESTGQSTNRSSGGNRDGYWEQKEKHDKEVVQPRITFLAAYERAIGFVDLALRNGAFAALEKAKPNDKLAVLDAFVNETAEKIVARANAKTPGPVLDAEVKEDADPDDSDEEWK